MGLCTHITARPVRGCLNAEPTPSLVQGQRTPQHQSARPRPRWASFPEALLAPVERLWFPLRGDTQGEVTSFAHSPLRATCLEGSSPTQDGSLNAGPPAPQVCERQDKFCSTPPSSQGPVHSVRLLSTWISTRHREQRRSGFLSWAWSSERLALSCVRGEDRLVPLGSPVLPARASESPLVMVR